MGLGLNATHREDFNDYELHKIPILPGQTSVALDFFPPDLPAPRVKEMKAHFATWIVACGFRELLEHYALFLDRVHSCCLLISVTKKALSDSDAKKVHKKFNGRGIPDKLDILS
ncbi:MAG TPA: hypothetical protein VNT79_13020, partial [Phycisphaerae bacterium]|nr:hypothetical protein [Phycisphaerae bacterium]